MLAEHKATKQRSIVVINGSDDKRLKLFKNELEELLFNFEDRYELIDFANCIFMAAQQKELGAHFLVKQKQSYKGHPSIILSILPTERSLA